MARFVTGKTFGTTETVTAALLNQAVNDAAISTDSVDGSTIEVNSNALRIKDNGVTLAKMATQADQTVLGNVSGGTAVPTAVPIVGGTGILIDDDALGTSDTKGATQGNIKAYVDSSANITATSNDNYVTSDITASGSADLGGLILKFGRFELSSDDAVTLTFPTAFPTACFYVHCIETRGTGLTAGKGISVPITAIGASSFTVNRYNEMDGSAGLSFFAIGH
jgi:hypothetical protein